MRRIKEALRLHLQGGLSYDEIGRALKISESSAGKYVSLARAAGVDFSSGATQTAFTEYWQAVTSADERVERLTKALEGSITGWRFEPAVGALQALRGVAAITTIGPVAEIGDLARFPHPRKLMVESAVATHLNGVVSAL